MEGFKGPERRPAPRFDLRAPVEFRANGQHGNGVIWNISLSGARIERASLTLTPGSPVWLRPSFYPGSSQVELPSRVIRPTDTGFAVQFAELGEPEQRLLRLALPGGGKTPLRSA